MSLREDENLVVTSALQEISALLELADQHPDAPALACPTMSPETMDMVGEFLGSCLLDELLASEIRTEARMWLEVALAGWPFDSPTARAIVRALGALTEFAPQEGEDPLPEPPATTPLERAVEAVATDPAARPALWKALWYGTVFLPVADVDFDDDEHAVFRFVTVDIDGEPAILAFTTEERLDLVGAAEPVGRIEPTGEELARLWPDNHWMILNPGFRLSTVLSDAEIKGLPAGPTVLVPDGESLGLTSPVSDDPRLVALSEARHSVAGVSELHWAQFRPDPLAKARDLLVVRVSEPRRSQAILASFSAAASRAGFDKALVLVADPEVQSDLTGQAARVGIAVN